MKNKIIKEKTIKQKKEHGNIDSSLEYFLRLNIPKNAKILDIGCNYGSLIYNLYKKGYKNVYGIDINKKTIKEGKKYYKEIRSKIKIYNGKKIPYQERNFCFSNTKQNNKYSMGNNKPKVFDKMEKISLLSSNKKGFIKKIKKFWF